jgi:hypothetical protein
MFNLPTLKAARDPEPTPSERREVLTLTAYVIRMGYVL